MSSDLLGIDAAAVGGLIAAAPANAADAYVALSYSLGSKVSGMAVAGSEAAAGTASLQNCQANGGGGCVTYVIAHNSCAAIAIGTDPTLHQEWSVATHSVVELARKQALSANAGASSEHRAARPASRPIRTGIRRSRLRRTRLLRIRRLRRPLIRWSTTTTTTG